MKKEKNDNDSLRACGMKELYVEQKYNPNHGKIFVSVIGLFYSSYDRKTHYAFYVPYKKSPTDTFCNTSFGHLTPTYSSDKLCIECKSVFEKGLA